MMLKKLALTGALALTFTANAAQAEVSEAQWQALNNAIIDQHLMPRYQTLSGAADLFQQQHQQFCQQINQQQLTNLQKDFRQLQDSWQAVQHFRFGPVEQLMRYQSMQFWPDKKNLTSKQLNKLLKAEDHEKLDEEFFRRASVAVKGLPAMERLLFSKNALSEYQQNQYRCLLSQAIADHIALVTREIHTEWQPFATDMKQANLAKGFYEDTIEASVDLMKGLVEPVEVIRNLKVLRPMGSTAAKAKPRRTESWRSARSLENIRTNLKSLDHLFQGTKPSVKHLLDTEHPQLSNKLQADFARVSQTLTLLPAPLYDTLETPERRPQLEQLADQLKSLHLNLELAMQALNIQLGFNSSDGD